MHHDIILSLQEHLRQKKKDDKKQKGLPAEQEATMRPLTCFGALVSLASTQPIAEPIKNVSRTLGIINHLLPTN